MKEKKLHIVCHDVPCPPDYGGVFDLYYKIRTLHEMGIGIILHCFDYGRGRENSLTQYCEEVHYYERRMGWKQVSLRRPYIVQSRMTPALRDRLLQDDYPVLLEGIHCTGYLPDLRQAGKKVVLRLHNVETEYYRYLAQCEKNLIRKIYYRFESYLLRRYEAALPNDLPIFCVAATDVAYYQNEFGKTNVQLIPVFLPCQDITSQEGMGNFCLYHGNLGVAENEKAAAWLLQNVFTKIKVPFVVAGKNPSRRIEKLAHLCQHTCLVSDPSEKEMNELISKAQINIIPSFNKTGIKIKLINALCKGKHCLTNEDAVNGSGWEDACHVALTGDAMASVILQLFHLPFAPEEIDLRKKLVKQFDNRKNAESLIRHLV